MVLPFLITIPFFICLTQKRTRAHRVVVDWPLAMIFDRFCIVLLYLKTLINISKELEHYRHADLPMQHKFSALQDSKAQWDRPEYYVSSLVKLDMKSYQNCEATTKEHQTNNNCLLLWSVNKARDCIVARSTITLILFRHDETKCINVKITIHKTRFDHCSTENHWNISEKEFRRCWFITVYKFSCFIVSCFIFVCFRLFFVSYKINKLNQITFPFTWTR